MDRKTPYLTLAVVACVFVGLLVINQVAASGDTSGSGDEYGASTGDEAETEPNEAENEPDENEQDESENEPDENEQDESADASQFPHRAVYAGRTANDGPALAIAVLGDEAAAYFCDGVSVEAWMKGKADDDGEISLRGSHSASIEGRLRGSAIVGSVEAGSNGQSYRFRLPIADPPAGLYRAEVGDGDTTIGWIVLPDGSQVGIQNSVGQTEPAPELTPGAAVDVDGRRVEPQAVTGDADF